MERAAPPRLLSLDVLGHARARRPAGLDRNVPRLVAVLFVLFWPGRFTILHRREIFLQV